jgi:hypothetical protein
VVRSPCFVFPFRFRVWLFASCQPDRCVVQATAISIVAALRITPFCRTALRVPSQTVADRVGECYAALERKAQLYEQLGAAASPSSRTW